VKTTERGPRGNASLGKTLTEKSRGKFSVGKKKSLRGVFGNVNELEGLHDFGFNSTG